MTSRYEYPYGPRPPGVSALPYRSPVLPALTCLVIWRRLRDSAIAAAASRCDTPGCGGRWHGALDSCRCRRCPDCMAASEGAAGGWPARPRLAADGPSHGTGWPALAPVPRAVPEGAAA